MNEYLPPKIRKAYQLHGRVRLHFPLPTMAKQSFKDECDVNKIMERFEKTGLISHVNKYQGDYGDAVGIQDYHASMNQVIAAQEAFDSLPSKIRARFGNNPGDFLNFMENPENKDEAIQLGLIKELDRADGLSNEVEAVNPVETSSGDQEDTTGATAPE